MFLKNIQLVDIRHTWLIYNKKHPSFPYVDQKEKKGAKSAGA